MRVHNPHGLGCFVKDYGVVPAGEDATVREGDGVKQMIKDGMLTDSSTSTKTDNKEADGDAARS